MHENLNAYQILLLVSLEYSGKGDYIVELFVTYH